MFKKDGQIVAPNAWVRWSSDGSGSPKSMVETQPMNATAQQLAAMGVTVEADVITPTPDPIIFIDYGTFRARWTDAEKAALFKVQQTDWRINDWINLAAAQGGVKLNGVDALAAKAAMVTANVLTQVRADVIFSIQ